MHKDNDKIQIDPNQFALAILGGKTQRADEDNKRFIKRELTLYLEAVLLAQSFNDLEENRFDVARADEVSRIWDKVIEKRY